MTGDDLDISLIAMVPDHGSIRTALIRVPRGGEKEVDIPQEDATVGQVENVARGFCQDALKLTQNW